MSLTAADVQRVVGGAYRVTRELGGGGMSRVFLAEDVALGRRVVLKALAPELQQAVSADRFAREVRVLAQLQHPGIVPVLAAGEAEGLAWYAMPYVDGESLRHRLDNGVPIPLAEARRWGHDLFDALAAAHAQGIAHRDIKPENLLLSGARAALADFGIAKAVRASADDARLTATGIALGTPAYMAPEQALADATADERVDLYAGGLVLYEMLAGRPPFAAATAQQVVASHLTETPPPVTTFRPEVPAALAALVAQCLEKEPARRPASASAVRDALDALVVVSDAQGLAAASPRPAAANGRWRLGLGLLAVGALVAIGVTRILRWPSATPAAADEMLVLADVVAPPADSATAAGWRLALEIDLESSARLHVPDPVRLRAARAAMQLPAAAPLDDTTALALATRVGAKAVIVPRLERIGGSYVLTVRVREAPSGRDVRSLRETARDSAALLDAMDRLGRGLREQLGESLASLEQRRPLPLLTTASLAALERAAAGAAAVTRYNNSAAATAYREAVGFDSTFAAAWLGLHNALQTIGVRPGLQFAVLRRALALRRNLSATERLRIEARWVELGGDLAGAASALRAAREADPRDREAWRELARVLLAAGQIREARIALDSLLAADAADLSARAIAVDAALADRDSAAAFALVRRNPLADEPGSWRLAHLVQAATRHWEAALAPVDSAVARLRGGEREAVAMQGQVYTLQVLGRHDEAARVTARRMTLALAQGDSTLALEAALLEIPGLAEGLGDRARARSRLDRAVRLVPPARLAPLDRPWSRLALAYAMVGDAATAATWLAAGASQSPAQVTSPHRPMRLQAEGWLALARGTPRGALAAFDSLAAIPGGEGCVAACADGLRGVAWEALGQADSARTAYARYLADMSPWHGYTDPFLLRRARARR